MKPSVKKSNTDRLLDSPVRNTRGEILADDPIK